MTTFARLGKSRLGKTRLGLGATYVPPLPPGPIIHTPQGAVLGSRFGRLGFMRLGKGYGDARIRPGLVSITSAPVTGTLHTDQNLTVALNELSLSQFVGDQHGSARALSFDPERQSARLGHRTARLGIMRLGKGHTDPGLHQLILLIFPPTVNLGVVLVIPINSLTLSILTGTVHTDQVLVQTLRSITLSTLAPIVHAGHSRPVALHNLTLTILPFTVNAGGPPTPKWMGNVVQYRNTLPADYNGKRRAMKSRR